MITLTTQDAALQSIDKDTADRIVALLGLSDVDYGDFFSARTCDFYDFYFDVLLEQKISCAIHTDWKWQPEHIFSQLNMSTLGNGIEIIAIKDNPDYLAFDITYVYESNEASIKVSHSEPNRLIENIEHHSSRLMGRSFVEIDFSEDSFSWLIVPEPFDVELFMHLTGLQASQNRPTLPPQPRSDSRHPNLATDYQQPQKIFFLPTIIYVENGVSAYMVQYRNQVESSQFNKERSSELLAHVWAGRVLPGQTVKEGIASELKEELSYVGRFDYVFAGYESTLKDKQGKDVHRYNLTIILYDRAFADTTKGGYIIELQKINDFDIDLLHRLTY